MSSAMRIISNGTLARSQERIHNYGRLIPTEVVLSS